MRIPPRSREGRRCCVADFPGRFEAGIDVGFEVDGTLKGFLLARLVEGEFGAAAPVALLDAIGVDPAAQGEGVARALLAGLDAVLRHKGVREVQSQVDWRNHALVRFFDAAGFELAPRAVLSREAALLANA